MSVLRIVADLETGDPNELAQFYEHIFGLKRAMDFDWIITSVSEAQSPVQLSFASQGGSDTPVPALSIEVDDLEATLALVRQNKVEIEYGPVDEPWGVRRFFVRDPAGNLLNVLTHGK